MTWKFTRAVAWPGVESILSLVVTIKGTRSRRLSDASWRAWESCHLDIIWEVVRVWLTIECTCVLIGIQAIIKNAASPIHHWVNSRRPHKVMNAIHLHVLPLARVSNYSTLHWFIFLAEILAVGDGYNYNNKAEIFDGDNNSWSRVDDYPFDRGQHNLNIRFVIDKSKCWSQVLAERYIAYAPIVYIRDSFYLIGGNVYGDDSKTIGRFDATRRVWSNSGELINKRSGNNAIYDGSSLIVIGGNGRYKTERCEISNGKVTCTAQTPELNNYVYYPELFLVQVNFCKTLS